MNLPRPGRRGSRDDYDALLARLTTAEQERDEWRVTAETLRDMENEAAKGLLRRVEALEAALHDVLDNMGGHSHWREGGAGGVCETCERQRHASSRARAALACPPPEEEK